jgi:hypothetical protein
LIKILKDVTCLSVLVLISELMLAMLLVSISSSGLLGRTEEGREARYASGDSGVE